MLDDLYALVDEPLRGHSEEEPAEDERAEAELGGEQVAHAATGQQAGHDAEDHRDEEHQRALSTADAQA